jgi:hypothetical protein
MVLCRSAGFQTGLECVDGLVDALQPEDTLTRFGNQRSANAQWVKVPSSRIPCVSCTFAPLRWFHFIFQVRRSALDVRSLVPLTS